MPEIPMNIFSRGSPEKSLNLYNRTINYIDPGYSSDEYTNLLLHFENSYFDSSYYYDPAIPYLHNNHVMSNTGGSFSNSVYKIGQYSAILNKNDSISTPESTDFNFGSNDFTIDFWVNAINGNTGTIICTQCTDTNNGWFLGPSTIGAGAILFDLLIGGMTTVRFSAPFIATNNIWQHIAFVVYRSSYLVFVNGVSQTLTFSVGSYTSFPSYTQPFYIGADPIFSGTGNSFVCRLDEFRVSSKARWISNFTPDAGSKIIELPININQVV